MLISEGKPAKDVEMTLVIGVAPGDACQLGSNSVVPRFMECDSPKNMFASFRTQYYYTPD